MLCFYLDASAWTKRFTNELGGDTVSALLQTVAADEMASLYTSSVAIAETAAAVNRYRNRVNMPDSEFIALINGILGDLNGVSRLPVLDSDYLDAIPLITRYHINSSDAVQLHGILYRLTTILSAQPSDIILVSSDSRFLRAARLTGLQTLDPTAFPLEAVPSLFEL
ncbi:MAG: type II toxin-antitoxin system VapC family toxin [Anaerolineae bacterium]|nr:type II toxin-antitoxin system VapC family toxin [Anaerolineae bacterium]